MPRKNILLAMFDIKPAGKAVSFILSRIKQELDLHVQKLATKETKKGKTIIEKAPLSPLPDSYWEELVAELPQRPDFFLKYQLASLNKQAILKELEGTMQEQVDVVSELASVGGQVYPRSVSKSRSKINTAKQNEGANATTKKNVEEVIESDNAALVGSALEEFWTSVGVESAPVADVVRVDVALESEIKMTPPTIKADLVVDNHPHSPVSREMEMWLENIRRNRGFLTPMHTKAYQKPQSLFRTKSKWSSWLRSNRKAMVYFLAMTLSGTAVWGLVARQGLIARDNIIQNGNNAVTNLENAKHELEDFNFIKAADSFALAYDDLNKASGTLSQLGASFLSVFGNLPGLNKLKAANNLVEAGQSLSKAGENLSLAFGTLYKTNLLSFLESGSGTEGRSISKLLTEFKDILNFADKNINHAAKLIADIDASVIPSDKQELFLDFKDKIPEFQQYVGDAVDYSDFLLKLVGSDGAKTYLVLLQNNSELRPTGGFPGSYALITFEDGALKKIFVDDIYRADVGIKENIVPPIPLQHITPNWGMRDAGWFADFTLSARKTIELYKLGGGPKVDGVLTITPDVIAKIFEVIGSIEMPEYGLTLNANNFLAEIQNEVEYEADRAAPKRILSDLQPKFFERLARQDKNGWLKIFKIISDAGMQKHILAYFENRDLEETAIKNGLGGEIKSPSTGSGQTRDYLQVVFANVKGSKTDSVTDNSMNLETEVGNNGALEHTLKISRIHNGGSSKYGFYNRDNSAYIKVYVPKGYILEGIQGQSITDFRSLIGHEDFGFKKDPDLERIESTIKRPFAGVDVFEESGKTVFGFWLITKPKQTKSVTLKYRTQVPVAEGSYGLLWQKQSGTGQDKISFSFKLVDGKIALNKSAELQLIGNSLVMNSDLAKDINIDITLR